MPGCSGRALLHPRSPRRTEASPLSLIPSGHYCRVTATGVLHHPHASVFPAAAFARERSTEPTTAFAERDEPSALRPHDRSFTRAQAGARRLGRLDLRERDHADLVPGVIALVANQESHARSKQQSDGCRPPRVIRLAHHPGDAVVRMPAARRLSAWHSSDADAGPLTIAFVRRTLRCLPDIGQAPDPSLPGERSGGRLDRVLPVSRERQPPKALSSSKWWLFRPTNSSPVDAGAASWSQGLCASGSRFWLV